MIGIYRIVLSILILFTAIAAQAEATAKDLILASCNFDCTMAFQNQAIAARAATIDAASSTKSVYATDPKVAATKAAPTADAANCKANQDYAALISASGSPELRATVDKAVNDACGVSADAAAVFNPAECVPQCYSKALAKLGVKEPSSNGGSDIAAILQLQQQQGDGGDTGIPNFAAGLPGQ